ncbi:SurA N-terminal domain-containing protein [Moraxella nasovis]|uniref:SurA N-terminal domain-containing protein n=1 Tax=Moraxella nasovis TaxID=2904121 RepID=UPI001F615456|nr:SurA N-terminal domain-containing protein [Moraxella nasovis]UNU73025.1 SurA N-terminal domain-containing protein [Moraxella nasovis]
MRNFLQSWPGRITLIAVLVPMAFLGVQGTLGTSISPNQLIKVGNQTVDVSTYQNQLNNYRSELLNSVDASMIDEAALSDQVLKSLVNSALLQNQAQVLGMTVSDEMITQLLQQEQTFWQDGQFSNERFAQYLTQNGLTKDMLFANFRQELALRQLSSGVLGTAIYPKSQVGRLLDLQLESREVWVHRFAWEDYADGINVSDSEIKAYFDANQASLIRPETVDLSYIELSAQDIKTAEPTQDEIAVQYDAYLQENGLGDGRELAQILLTGADSEKRAKDIAAKLKAGQSFEKLAKQYSDDPSGKTGGLIGAYNPAVFGDDAAAVTQALSGLSLGDFSQPVKTKYGYQIFKVVKLGNAPSMESMRAELQNRAINYKRQVELNEKIAKINEMAATGVGVADIAAELGLKLKRITDYPKTQNQTALPQPAVIAAAFDEFAIEDQAVSANISLGDKTVWVQPGNYQASAPLTLAQAHDQIKHALVKQKAVEKALAAAHEAVNDANNENAIKALMVPQANLGIVTRSTPTLNTQERASLFSKKSASGHDVWTVKTEDGASIMVGGPVLSQTHEQLSLTERLQAAAMIRSNVGQDQLSDYLQYLRTTNEVTINQDALTGQTH